MTGRALTAVLFLGIAVGAAPARAKTVEVLSAADSGPDTFRAAVTAANADPAVDRIAFQVATPSVALAAPVLYSGAQALVIDGAGATVISILARTVQRDRALSRR